MFDNSNLTKDASFENTLFASFPLEPSQDPPNHRKTCPHGDYTRSDLAGTISWTNPSANELATKPATKKGT
jgi:hypothetical protein